MQNLTATQQAVVTAGVRGLVGVGFLLAPGFAVRNWLGPQADTAPARVLGRAIGAREVALLGRASVALQRGESLRPWLELGAVADAADGVLVGLAGSVPLRRRLPVALGAVLAAGSTYGVARRLGP